MPEELSLAYGPWKTVFSGTWDAFKASVYSNADKLLLMLVFDAKNPRSALAVLKKAFVLEGESAEFVNFLNSQKRAFTVVEKVSRTTRQKYLLLESEPAFVESIQQEIGEVLRAQYSFLESVGKALAGVAPSYGARVKDLKNASEEAADLLLGDPLSLFLLKQTKELAGAAAVAKPVVKMFLGIDSGNEFLEPDLRELRAVVVVGENSTRRKRLLHLLCENALLNNVSCILLATSNDLTGLGESAPNRNGFEAFSLRGEPHGFPLKRFSPTEGVRVDLRLVEPSVFTSILGLNNDAGEAIREAFAPLLPNLVSSPPSSLEALRKNVEALDAKKFPAYVVRKALRVLQLLEEENPFLFQEDKLELMQKNFGEIKEKTLASVYFIDLSNASREAKQLIACSLAGFLQKIFADAYAAGGELNAFVAVEEDASELSEEIVKALAEASGKGIGFALNAAHSIDVKSVPATLAIELVGDQAFATIKGKKTRFAPRPTYSNSSKIS